MQQFGHSLLHLPPVAGMMTGLGFLKLFGYCLQGRDERHAYISNTVLMSTALAINSEPAEESMPVRPAFAV